MEIFIVGFDVVNHFTRNGCAIEDLYDDVSRVFFAEAKSDQYRRANVTLNYVIHQNLNN